MLESSMNSDDRTTQFIVSDDARILTKSSFLQK